MRDIFKDTKNPVFTGKEIINWCEHEIITRGRKAHEASKLLNHYNFITNHKYRRTRLRMGPGQQGDRVLPYKIGFVREEDEG